MNCHKSYFSELFGFSKELEGIEMNFKDQKLEEEFEISNSSKEKTKSEQVG